MKNIFNFVGGILKWEQQCRLMHMCTRKYLCVDQGGKVTLTSDHLDPKTVFRLHPVIRVGSTNNFDKKKIGFLILTMTLCRFDSKIFNRECCETRDFFGNFGKGP